MNIDKKEKLFICQNVDKQVEEIKNNMKFIKELLTDDKYTVYGWAYVTEHGELIDFCFTNELPSYFTNNPAPCSSYIKWSLEEKEK